MTNQGDAIAGTAAEHTLALLLSGTRGTTRMVAKQAAHQWDRSFDPPLFSREDREVVLVGLGNLGHEIARRCRPSGARVIGVARGVVVNQEALDRACALGRSARRRSTSPILNRWQLTTLWDLPRLLIYPHTAGAGSSSASRKIAALVSTNINRYRRGTPLVNVV